MVGVMLSRTQNENGTFNTRCLHCLMTVAISVESARQLEQVEARHLCPERVLASLAAANAHRADELHIR